MHNGDKLGGDKDFTRNLKLLDRRVSRSIRDFGLIPDGGKVMVALSGGKDSLTLMHVLARRRAWRADKYELVAGHVRGGLGCSGGCASIAKLESACADLQVPLVVAEGRMPSADQVRDGKSPCFVCSWHRRKAIFETADEQGCSVVAFGHHRDDAAQTLLMNLLWRGKHETMLPRQPMFGGRITIIRPLINVDEEFIVRIAKLGRLPVRPCICPFGVQSRREQVSKLISSLRENGCKDVSGNLLRSALSGWDPDSGGHPSRKRH